MGLGAVQVAELNGRAHMQYSSLPLQQIVHITMAKPSELALENAKDNSQLDKKSPEIVDGEEYDEEDDDDYDPLNKPPEENEHSDDSDGEPEPDYSSINTGMSQVRTRTQRYQESGGSLKPKLGTSGLVKNESSGLNVDALFQSLQDGNVNKEWSRYIKEDTPKEEEQPKLLTEESVEQIRIETTYTFAGKLVRESRMVDVNSAEAKAYLNSTSGIMSGKADETGHKLYVTVLRNIPGGEEQVPLRIKLKRPSLIDKFLAGDKKNKLTTLEKSRLDWASFVDKKKIKDDLSLHNKAGYLEKQDFLGRMDAKRDMEYQKAKELDRQRQWQLQQKNT